MIGYRVLAFFLDFWIINFLGFFLSLPYWSDILIYYPDYIMVYLFGINFTIIFLYFFLFELILRKTPGKAVLKLKVEKSQDSNLPWFMRILIRTICRFIPLEPFSFLLFKNEYWLHDKFSKTIVVKS